MMVLINPANRGIRTVHPASYSPGREFRGAEELNNPADDIRISRRSAAFDHGPDLE